MYIGLAAKEDGGWGQYRSSLQCLPSVLLRAQAKWVGLRVALFPADCDRIWLSAFHSKFIRSGRGTTHKSLHGAGVAEPDREEIQRVYGKPVEPLALLQGKVGRIAATLQLM